MPRLDSLVYKTKENSGELLSLGFFRNFLREADTFLVLHLYDFYFFSRTKVSADANLLTASEVFLSFSCKTIFLLSTNFKIITKPMHHYKCSLYTCNLCRTPIWCDTKCFIIQIHFSHLVFSPTIFKISRIHIFKS